MLAAFVLISLHVLPLEQDRALVREHLLEAETYARAHPPPGLTAAQLKNRELNLARLHAYMLAGRYPLNRDFDHPMPYFIDADGTRCAMAYLIENAGGAEFVQKVHRERNNAFVRELKDEPELKAWLAENGLTAEEAALIQPSYTPRCQPLRAMSLCRGAPGVPVELVTVDEGDGGISVRFSRDLSSVPSGLTPSDQLYDVTTVADVPGVRYFATQPQGASGGAVQVGLVVGDAGVISLLDSNCSPAPTLSEDALASIVLTSDAGVCASKLNDADPRFSEMFCTPLGEPLPLCFPDGGKDPAKKPGPTTGCGCTSTTGFWFIAPLFALFALRRRYSR